MRDQVKDRGGTNVHSQWNLPWEDPLQPVKDVSACLHIYGKKGSQCFLQSQEQRYD